MKVGGKGDNGINLHIFRRGKTRRVGALLKAKHTLLKKYALEMRLQIFLPQVENSTVCETFLPHCQILK